MNKNTNMKETSFEIKTTLPTEVINLNQVKGDIELAKTPDLLIKASKYYADTVTELKAAEKVLKAAIDDPVKKLKAIKETLKNLETDIKNKALSMVEVVQEQKVNATTGEITYEKTHNLSTLAFSFTPEQVIVGIDFDAIQAEYDKNGEKSKYRHYCEKQVTYKLDLNKLKADLATGTKFPKSTKTTAEKISIQVKNLTDVKKQEEIISAIELADIPKAKDELPEVEL